jgi:proteasome lid subunit RPN8/RPN11
MTSSIYMRTLIHRFTYQLLLTASYDMDEWVVIPYHSLLSAICTKSLLDVDSQLSSDVSQHLSSSRVYIAYMHVYQSSTHKNFSGPETAFSSIPI